MPDDTTVQNDYTDLLQSLSDAVRSGNDSLSSIQISVSEMEDIINRQYENQETNTETISPDDYYQDSLTHYQNLQDLITMQIISIYILIGVVLALIFSQFWRFKYK